MWHENLLRDRGFSTSFFLCYSYWSWNYWKTAKQINNRNGYATYVCVIDNLIYP